MRSLLKNPLTLFQAGPYTFRSVTDSDMLAYFAPGALLCSDCINIVLYKRMQF